MEKLFVIALGGALGSVLRYLVSGGLSQFTSGSFPFGTLSVNVIGSALIGFLWGLFDEMVISPQWRGFIFIGVLGAFTTFSTFTFESFDLLRNGDIRIAFFYILASNLVGIAVVFGGFLLSKHTLLFLR